MHRPINLRFSQQIFDKINVILPPGVVPCGRSYSRTDVATLIVAILQTRLKVARDLLARALNCDQNYTQNSINRGREEQSVCGAVDMRLKFTHSVTPELHVSLHQRPYL